MNTQVLQNVDSTLLPYAHSNYVLALIEVHLPTLFHEQLVFSQFITALRRVTVQAHPDRNNGTVSTAGMLATTLLSMRSTASRVEAGVSLLEEFYGLYTERWAISGSYLRITDNRSIHWSDYVRSAEQFRTAEQYRAQREQADMDKLIEEEARKKEEERARADFLVSCGLNWDGTGIKIEEAVEQEQKPIQDSFLYSNETQSEVPSSTSRLDQGDYYQFDDEKPHRPLPFSSFHVKKEEFCTYIMSPSRSWCDPNEQTAWDDQAGGTVWDEFDEFPPAPVISSDAENGDASEDVAAQETPAFHDAATSVIDEAAVESTSRTRSASSSTPPSDNLHPGVVGDETNGMFSPARSPALSSSNAAPPSSTPSVRRSSRKGKVPDYRSQLMVDEDPSDDGDDSGDGGSDDPDPSDSDDHGGDNDECISCRVYARAVESRDQLIAETQAKIKVLQQQLDARRKRQRSDSSYQATSDDDTRPSLPSNKRARVSKAPATPSPSAPPTAGPGPSSRSRRAPTGDSSDENDTDMQEAATPTSSARRVRWTAEDEEDYMSYCLEYLRAKYGASRNPRQEGSKTRPLCLAGAFVRELRDWFGPAHHFFSRFTAQLQQNLCRLLKEEVGKELREYYVSLWDAEEDCPLVKTRKRRQE